MPGCSAFNQLGQYTNSPGNRAYCYAEFPVFEAWFVFKAQHLLVHLHLAYSNKLMAPCYHILLHGLLAELGSLNSFIALAFLLPVSRPTRRHHDELMTQLTYYNRCT